MVTSSLVLLSLVLGLAPAEETHTIKIKKSAKGDVVKVENTEAVDTTVVATDSAGNEVLNKKDKNSKNELYQETVVDKPDGGDRATSLKRAYETARATKEGKEETRAYEGKTVLIKKEGDKYKFTIDGGKELTGKDAEDLDKSFNKKSEKSDEELEKFFLPGKAVKVGETWKIDAEGFLKEMAKEDKDATMVFDTAKTESSGKLLEVYKKNGHDFGKMAFKIAAPLKSFAAGGMKFKVKEGSKVNLEMQFDVCIDGADGSGVIKMDATVNIDATVPTPDGKEVTMAVNVKSTGTQKNTEVTKK